MNIHQTLTESIFMYPITLGALLVPPHNCLLNSEMKTILMFHTPTELIWKGRKIAWPLQNHEGAFPLLCFGY